MLMPIKRMCMSTRTVIRVQSRRACCRYILTDLAVLFLHQIVTNLIVLMISQHEPVIESV